MCEVYVLAHTCKDHIGHASICVIGDVLMSLSAMLMLVVSLIILCMLAQLHVTPAHNLPGVHVWQSSLCLRL